MAFLLIVGGAFGMIMRTGAITAVLERSLAKQGDTGGRIVPVLFVVFSLSGAVFGMGEEAIVFTLIVTPALIRVGFDAATGVMVTYVATQIGFATSWMNPFSVVIAQGIAGVPALSGMEYRVFLWCLFTLFGAGFAQWHARRVLADPRRSPTPNIDKIIAAEAQGDSEKPDASLVHLAILAIVAVGVIWIMWGVVAEGYYLPEIATQFLAMGLVVAVLAIVTGLEKLTASDFAVAFKEGAMQMAPAAIVIGFAKGIVFLMGGDDPTSPSILNTILFYLSGATNGLVDWLAATAMFLLQSGINFLVVSGSGQAALTMPLMTPLADLSGVSRQTAVLAFQLGDGLTNINCPASAALMGCLSAARIDWIVWAKFILKFQLGLVALASVMVMLAALFGYQ